MTEVAIQSNERPPLVDTHVKNFVIGGAAEPLVADSHYVVTVIAQQSYCARANILINFDFHTAGSGGTGIIRSRVASAP